MPNEPPLNKLLWGITLALLVAIFIYIIEDPPQQDPLNNLTTEEYRQSYSNCVINSTCNLYIGPTAVHECITDCMRLKIPNSTYKSRQQFRPLIIGSTSTHSINLTEKLQ